jgi:hypothetical protein
MTTYRVSISSMVASYVERWEAESPREAEERARTRWQREFGDAGAFRFFAQPDRPKRRDEDDED